jgi:hypothetical protein
MKLSFFGGKKRRKTIIIVPQLSKICHCYNDHNDTQKKVLNIFFNWEKGESLVLIKPEYFKSSKSNFRL